MTGAVDQKETECGGCCSVIVSARKWSAFLSTDFSKLHAFGGRGRDFSSACLECCGATRAYCRRIITPGVVVLQRPHIVPTLTDRRLPLSTKSMTRVSSV